MYEHLQGRRYQPNHPLPVCFIREFLLPTMSKTRSTSSSAQGLPDYLLDDLCASIVDLIYLEDDKTMTVRQMQNNAGSLRIYWNEST